MRDALLDVTALVLTVGEPSLGRALAALDAQTRPAAQRVLIEDVDGFAAAFNQGVERVTTELMLQCDADMMLDPDCLEVLRRSMTADAGLCLAKLDDPLLGPIEGIKLFRTSLLRRWPLAATLIAETEQVASLRAAGYAVVQAQREAPRPGRALDVLGSHEPAYDDPAYVWDRFVRLGRKARLRRRAHVFRRFLASLRTSPHPCSELALIALCHGFAHQDSPNRHGKVRARPQLAALLDLLSSGEGQ